MHVKTICARGALTEPEIGRPLAPIIVTAATFGFAHQAEVDRYYETGEGFLYSRYENPTVRQAERLLAELEGAEGAALFASGMAAISTLLLTLAGSGQRVAAQRELYGGTAELLRQVLPGLGVGVDWVDLDALGRLEPPHLEGRRLLFLETPTNPTLRLVDLRRACEVARLARVPVAVDSTFATPVLQRPLELGADFVVHSATKYLGGHADLLGGGIAGSRDALEPVLRRRRLLGGTLDPFSAFLLHRGMRTLAVRVEAQCETAQRVAQALAEHPAVERVLYPGLADHPDAELARRQMGAGGGVVAFTARAGARAAERVHDGLACFSRAGSLGGVGSLVSIPARMSHRHLDEEERSRMGVPANLIRLAIGLESADELIDDLRRALEP